MAATSITKKARNRKIKSIFGVGTNDADYAIISLVDGLQVKCPFYLKWTLMIQRCYDSNYHKHKPTYAGCEVAEEWHLFSAFRAWMTEQHWEGNQLDKDFLSQSRTYSKYTCVFIPNWLNMLFHTESHKKSMLPQGVSRCRDSYQAHLSVKGIHTYLGTFCSPEAAHAAYVAAKTDYVRSRYPEIALIDPRLVEACEQKLSNL